MLETGVGLDGLAEYVESTELRVLISAVTIGVLLVVLQTYGRLQVWISERTRPLYGDITAATLLVMISAGTIAIVLGIWEQTGTIWSVYSDHELSGEFLPNAVASFVLVIGTLIVTRFVSRLIDEVLGSASTVTAHQREITHRIAQLIVWSMALVVVLGVWIDDLGGLLVGAGFLGIVVGMAARQTLGTVLSGFVMMFARPFEIGDWIVVEDDQGIVTDISIVNTRIRSFDGEYIMIPNDVVASSTVTNRSKRGRLRVDIDVGVDYETDVERASVLAESVVSDLEYAESAPSPQVVTKEFGDSAVVLGVRFWIDSPTARRHWEARTAAINAIKRAFQAEGIKIPFPQRELAGRAETGGFQVTSASGPDARARTTHAREESYADDSSAANDTEQEFSHTDDSR